MATIGNIWPTRIDEEMRSSYMSYAMSVIVSRALPDVCDGLKPVQRRILYAMNQMSLSPGSSYKKSAGIIGEVMGKYHPHGDSPIYDALVRMAQSFSMRYPLIDGQGNFGSVDNDPPAAMRYTEARLAAIAQEMLTDIDMDTVDFSENFDGSQQEPTVLPGLLPNMLVNGASGIAVGMATNIPPHNLGEICDAVGHLIDHPNTTPDELMEFVPGPDFPTGGIICGRSGIVDAYARGQGRAIMRANTSVEEIKGGREQIVITELPFQTNKSSLVERIAHLARDKKIDGISDVRDESDREGLRVVVELRRDADNRVVLNNLFANTPMQSTFNIIMLALVHGQPQVLNLRQALKYYIEHREGIVTRRSQYMLRKAEERLHIVDGLRTALQNLEQVISIIRSAADVAAARQGLMEQLTLTDIQAQAILDMQLRRLAALEQKKLEDEYQELLKTISELETLLADPARVLAVVKEETKKVKKKFADPRRTEIINEEPTSFSIEEITPHQDVVVTISQRGYVKRIPMSTYKIQHRGGKGIRGMSTRDGDVLQDLLLADTHDILLFFTDRGRVYPLKAFQIPGDTSRITRGTPLVNLLPLNEGERVHALVSISDRRFHGVILLGTRMGEIKALDLSLLANIRKGGLNVMDLEKGDEQVSVRLATEEDDAIMTTAKGMAIRFPVNQLRLRSRAAGGVRGIRLSSEDFVVSMEVIHAQHRLLLVTEKGYGKLVRVQNYRTQSRGGQGLITFRVSDMTGKLADARVVSEGSEENVMLVSAKCQVIRISLGQIPQQGRHTRGAIVWKGRSGDTVASVACFSQRPRSTEAENPQEIKESTSPQSNGEKP